MSESLNQDTISAFIVERLATQARLPVNSIDIHSPLANYGMDSIHAFSLCAELEDWLGIEIEPTIAWDYPTIAQMAEFLQSEIATVER